jgi:uncharacterized protein with ATP-grasp and redox domains
VKVSIDCVHCYFKQAVSCMKIAGIEDENRQHEVLYELMDYVKTFNTEASPAENSTKIFLKTYELIGNEDPYKEIKKQSNDLALKLYPGLKQKLEESDDRLYDALRIAAAGNIIDLGINRSFDIHGALVHSMNTGFSKDHYKDFVNKLENTQEVLILGDNSGEIVFDKILVEELLRLGKQVTYVVKEAPILNDATMEDALYVGMDKVAKVITNGSNYLGVCLDRVPEGFINTLRNASLVIAKGHANFESLEQEEMVKEKVFFLLKVKCEHVGCIAGAELGDVMFFTRK